MEVTGLGGTVSSWYKCAKEMPLPDGVCLTPTPGSCEKIIQKGLD